jgi:hypothetical protein
MLGRTGALGRRQAGVSGANVGGARDDVRLGARMQGHASRAGVAERV